jgi:hypothetical protein
MRTHATSRWSSANPPMTEVPRRTPPESENLVGLDSVVRWSQIEFDFLESSIRTLQLQHPHNVLYREMLDRVTQLRQHARGIAITRNDQLDAAIYGIATGGLLGQPVVVNPRRQLETADDLTTPEATRRAPPCGPAPEIHRIRFEHLFSSPTVFVHTSVIMTAGNARNHPESGYSILTPRSKNGGPDLRYSYGVYGGMLLTAILPLMGIARVQVCDAYKFKIEKGAVFGWNEIMPRIAYMLHKVWLELFHKAPEFSVTSNSAVGDLRADQVYDVYSIVNNPPTEEEEKPMLRRFDLGGSSD